MQFLLFAVSCCLFAAPLANAGATAVGLVSAAGHPVEKVITMIQGLEEQAVAEGKQEALLYDKFDHWCANSVKALDAAIADEKESIDELKSTIDSKKESQSMLTEQIGKLTDEIAELQEAAAKATFLRGQEAAAYSEADKEYAATLKAIADAIKALEDAKTSTTGFLQAQRRVHEALALGADGQANEEQRAELVAFTQESPMIVTERPELQAAGDYDSHINKYSFKSGSVVELLKQLALKFEDERTESTKEETNSLNAYELAKNAGDDSIAKAKASKETKTHELAEVTADLATAEGELANTEEDLKANSELLAETQKACAIKKSEWAERSETRTNEIKAMEAAINILAEATGLRTEPPSNPVPPPSPVAAGFLQITEDPKIRAVQLLRESARATQSHALERLAQEISAHLTGPFDDVNNMIEKMIFRLMAEQKDEDVHKNWCDLELNKTDVSKTNKEDKMDELYLKIEEAKAMVQELTEQIQSANEMVVKIAVHMDESTEIRDIGKQENALATKDAQQAQEALANAIAVLEDFYKQSGMVAKEPWEFLQRGVELPEKPATWESSYTGVADPVDQPDGIITVLKKISADFAQMESQTAAQEESDQKLYEDDMKLNTIEKARLAKESEMKEEEKKRMVDKIASMGEQLKHVSDEHAAVVQYLKDLQHGCVDGDSTYDDRKAARAKEITALQEAQVILRDAFKSSTVNASLAQVEAQRAVGGALASKASFLLRVRPGRNL